MLRWSCRVPFVALILATLATPTIADAQTAAEVKLLTFRADAVDGVDLLIVRDQSVTIEHRQYREIVGAQSVIHSELPREGTYRVSVRDKVGRPRVSVTQQPNAANHYEVRVVLDDGPAAGASPISFDLVATPFVAPANPKNIVVITIDSLRADHLGCYGYPRPTSPNLDRFAGDSVVYERAFSTSSFTPPSHASLMTSRYVGDHGLYTWNRLPDEQLTLAEILLRHGYRTGASVNIGLLSDQGLGQGFQFQQDAYRDARDIIDDALAFIRDESADPYFLWLHFYDVHRPYGRVRNWTDRFSDAPRPGIGDDENHYGLRPSDRDERGLDEEDLRYIVDRYDAGIAYIDAQLAPLLTELSNPLVAGDTMVVITADHGESLLDHPERLFTHDPFLFTAVTRVPLLIRYPGGSSGSKRFDGLVSLIDIAPTILGVVGIEAPPTFMGRDASAARGRRSWDRPVVYFECWGWEELKAVRTEDRLIVRDLKKRETRFYDLSKDPGERDPHFKATDAAARQLEKSLQEFTLRRPDTDGPPALDPAVIEKLRELGYLGG